jgi:hypothetical protein
MKESCPLASLSFHDFDQSFQIGRITKAVNVDLESPAVRLVRIVALLHLAFPQSTPELFFFFAVDRNPGEG